MPATVIYHSADFDGIFCCEIARRHLPSDTEFIGWNFGDDAVVPPGGDAPLYILDLPVDRVLGVSSVAGNMLWPTNLIWIDHHKSAIESHPESIPGYRIDGVAACRLAWQWFSRDSGTMGLPPKQAYSDRAVSEPWAVRLAGEYDIWDKRDPDADAFQFGLRSVPHGELNWSMLLDECRWQPLHDYVQRLLADGQLLQRYQQDVDASVMKHRSFFVEFEGMRFLALNTARCNSLSFAARDVSETGHQALLGFYWAGSAWSVSLYHAAHRTDLDLSLIAVKYGGGGHRGACGFSCEELPFRLCPY